MVRLKFWIKWILKVLSLPWVGVMFCVPGGAPRPYFGSFLRNHVGPDLKAINLIKRFGNHWWGCNIIYVISGIAPPLSFLRWAKKYGARIILNQNGFPRQRWVAEKLVEIHQMVRYVVFQSEFCYNEWVKRVAGKHIKWILYNPVDLEKFTSGKKTFTDLDIRLLVKSGTPGTIRYLNGHYHTLTRLTEKEISNDDMPEVYRNHDIFVDLKINDPCPNAVLEAMACGLPIIYHNSGGTPELVGDAGVAYEELTKESVLKAVEEVESRYDELSRRARGRAKLFDMEKWYGEHRKMFEAVWIN